MSMTEVIVLESFHIAGVGLAAVNSLAVIPTDLALILLNARKVKLAKTPASGPTGLGPVMGTADGAAMVLPLGNVVRLTRVLANSGIPLALPPSGSMGNNGSVSFGTAAPSAFSGFIYFHDNVIVAGSPAGWYWTEMNTDASGQVFNNIYLTGNPKKPDVLVPFTSVGPGAFSGLTSGSYQTFVNVTVPANAMGPNGCLRMFFRIGFNSTAGGRQRQIYFGGQQFFNLGLAAERAYEFMPMIFNRGVTNRQVVHALNNIVTNNASASPPTYGTVETNAPQLIQYVASKDGAADWYLLESSSIEVVPGD